MDFAILMAAALFVAYANGTNDNFKGVATLYGSGRMGFGAALGLGNGATLLGSLAALFLAKTLMAKFGGAGLVPDAVALKPAFALAVALAAAATVLGATRLGLPVSTTHALVGALAGAGLFASSQGVAWGVLARSLMMPLVVSPLLAIAVGALVTSLARAVSRRSGLRADDCVCVAPAALAAGPDTLTVSDAPLLVSGDLAGCAPATGTFVSAGGVRDALHGLSGAAVSFARGLNDTPKMAGLLLLAGSLKPDLALPLTGGAILLGGLLGARRVGETLSHRITDMDVNEGLGANLVTAGLVLGASALGMPVSTTHVSCGALFGMGAVTGKARWRMIGGIVFAWVVTLPFAAVTAALAWQGLGWVHGGAW